jgi:peroxiredoxin
MAMLLVDDKFPDIELSLVGGETISLPKDIEGSWAYVLFYRGGW